MHPSLFTSFDAVRRGDPTSPRWARGVRFLLLVSFAVHLALLASLPGAGPEAVAVVVAVAVASACGGLLTALVTDGRLYGFPRIVVVRAAVALVLYLIVWAFGASRGGPVVELGAWGVAAAVIDVLTGRYLVLGILRESALGRRAGA
ncbi:hypothetical protein [Pseudonocardia sp. WMMC193]|uniref:hypothetical protein n=1 Tax=Pseudonocardia sp. WMMC193 TaxID=2911965 RepID=UPI001F1E43F7|nr:hypothetical protein [Pseudonocardia sp. WMMC193]MCF7553738.1 hypothetical protein [Pseudonocardia sp. WMMC193]